MVEDSSASESEAKTKLIEELKQQLADKEQN